MKRTSAVILEAAHSFRVTSLPNGRVKIELEDVETKDLEPTEPSTVYDKAGVARRLGVGKRSIDNYIRQTRHPLPYSISMGRAKFLESDVIEWIKQGQSAAAKRVKARLKS
jgi:predicted DNA-binding transcriptional regulator AlpA